MRSPDAGTTWVESGPTNAWAAIVCSADGATGFTASRSPARSGDGLVYASTDSGVTWNSTEAPRNDWAALACSADGSKVFLAASLSNSVTQLWGGGDGVVYASTNSGDLDSHLRANQPIHFDCVFHQRCTSNTWTSAACSADGRRLFAGSGSAGENDPFSAEVYTYDGIYGSSDSGASWVRTSAPTNYDWQSISCSADGAKVVAIAAAIIPNLLWPNAARTIFVSTNAGLDWVSAQAPAEGWSTVTCSGNGSNIVAAAAPGPVCTLRLPAPPPPTLVPPRLSVVQSGAGLRFSWIVPSTSFALQQTPDLRAANWSDVPTLPTLNFANLRQELVLSTSNQSSFYRLKQR